MRMPKKSAVKKQEKRTPHSHFALCGVFFKKTFAHFKISNYFCTANLQGAIAQLVEQRTENPCVPGSIPGGTTLKRLAVLLRGVFV